MVVRPALGRRGSGPVRQCTLDHQTFCRVMVGSARLAAVLAILLVRPASPARGVVFPGNDYLGRTAGQDTVDSNQVELDFGFTTPPSSVD